MTYPIGSEDYIQSYRYISPPAGDFAGYLADQEYQLGQLETTRANLDPADEGGWEALEAEFAILLDSFRALYTAPYLDKAKALCEQAEAGSAAVVDHRRGEAMRDKFSTKLVEVDESTGIDSIIQCS